MAFRSDNEKGGAISDPAVVEGMKYHFDINFVSTLERPDPEDHCQIKWRQAEWGSR
jgi:hypothetical protein